MSNIQFKNNIIAPDINSKGVLKFEPVMKSIIEKNEKNAEIEKGNRQFKIPIN